MAFCLELAGDKLAAAQAWRDVPEALWSSRIDWTESRARAAAPAPAPPVRRAAAPARTDAQIVSDQLRRLAAHPCATEPLAMLEQRGNGEAFVAAIAARPTDCPQHGDWASRAVERLIADGAFDRAIAMARPVAALEGSPTAVREQLGVLLHWTGSDARGRTGTPGRGLGRSGADARHHRARSRYCAQRATATPRGRWPMSRGGTAVRPNRASASPSSRSRRAASPRRWPWRGRSSRTISSEAERRPWRVPRCWHSAIPSRHGACSSRSFPRPTPAWHGSTPWPRPKGCSAPWLPPTSCP